MNSTLFCLNSSWNEIDYISKILGSQAQPFWKAFTYSLIYIIILLSGIFGNLCTCIVILRNRSLQTVTNCYLFSLAVSDLLTLVIGLPPEVYQVWNEWPWRLGEFYCYFKMFVMEVTTYTSVLTITAFSIERFVAIYYPVFAKQHMSGISRAAIILISLWFFAIVCGLPLLIHAKLYYFIDSPCPKPDGPTKLENSLVCYVPDEKVRTTLMYMSSFAFFLLPLLIITILYGLIAVKLRKQPSHVERHYGEAQGVPSPSRVRLLSSHEVSSSSPKKKSMRFKLLSNWSSRRQDPSRQSKSARHERAVTMLFAVVVAFFICWAPFHAQRLIPLFVPVGTASPAVQTLQNILYYTSGVLLYASSTVNPILYNLMSTRFRAAFRQSICFCCASISSGDKPRILRKPSWRIKHYRYQRDNGRAKRGNTSDDDIPVAADNSEKYGSTVL